MDCDIKQYFLDLPYPPVETCGKNPHYAALLTRDYAGQDGEITAVTTYLFQHFICCNEKIHCAMKAVARVEMMHFGFLGELIHKFGGCPTVGVQQNGRTCFWSGQYNCYNTDPCCFLKSNIEAEQKAINSYWNRIAQIEDEPTRKLLKRIIKDEEHHIEIFKGLLCEIS